MSDRSLIATGAIGVILAVLCCATPLLAVVLTAIGLTAVLSKADYVVIAVFMLGVAVAGFGLYRRRLAAACCDSTTKDKGSA